MSRMTALVVALAAVFPRLPGRPGLWRQVPDGRARREVPARLRVGLPRQGADLRRPSTEPKAAIRDPQLHKALRQAGHAVSVIEDWALLEQALKRQPVDVVLRRCRRAARLAPSYVLRAIRSRCTSRPPRRRPSEPGLPAQVVRWPLKYLEEVENVMKARSKHAESS